MRILFSLISALLINHNSSSLLDLLKYLTIVASSSSDLALRLYENQVCDLILNLLNSCTTNDVNQGSSKSSVNLAQLSSIIELAFELLPSTPAGNANHC